MPLTSASQLEGLMRGQTQQLKINKTASRTTIANRWFTTFDLAGNPAAGTLAGVSIEGVVQNGTPKDLSTFSTFNYPPFFEMINLEDITFVEELWNYYVTKVEASNTVASRLAIFDCVIKYGSFSFDADEKPETVFDETLYRSPNNSDIDIYTSELEYWIQINTPFATQPTFNIEDHAGSAWAINCATRGITPNTVGELIPLNNTASTFDSNIHSISGASSIVCTDGGSAGGFDVLVMRKIWEGAIPFANEQIVHNYESTGLVRIPFDAALILAVASNSTSSGLPEVVLDVVFSE